ncbi:MAG: T9SS type A sorting domain-containing protein [Candidatus Edwardsbacteria bacterium]|jgi:hypothetical protein|nr:T9SS type A sorting domain-containing protein [Candidatus Edwardsbacteria bacterium]
MKRTLAFLLLALTAAPAFAAPVITDVTQWPDTAATGPYVVAAVVRDTSFALQDSALHYAYNPGPDDNPAGWGGVAWADSQRGDTMYFVIPAIPAGLETPVRIGYAVSAMNLIYEETYSPASGYYSFDNTIYSPHYGSVTVLQDTFHSGPLVVRAEITTAYGDSVANDYLYSDLLGGAEYPRDSVGADGAYYYAIPRHPGGTQTPVTAFWYLGSGDTMGNLASFPLKRDTLNHFVFIDPMPANVRPLANTGEPGPFPVWVDYKAEGAVASDSLWVFDGSDFQPCPRDSVGGTSPQRHYYTIPAQPQPVIDPVNVLWHLKAYDAASGNYTYQPAGAPWPSYSFYIYDRTPPAIDSLTLLDNVVAPGPRAVLADARDTSGILQIRVYYRTRPNADTSWQYLPMYATATPGRYRATLPLVPAGSLVQYYVAAVDGARDENAVALRNTAYAPAGGPRTPWHYFVGEHPHRVLLVDDQLPANGYEGAYTAALDTTGVLYGRWDNRASDVLPQLGSFNTLVWFTGDDSVATLGQRDRDTLAAFLDRGGNLLLFSKNLGQNIGDTAVFYHDYLKAQFYGNRSTQFFLVGRDAYPLSYGPVDTILVSGSSEIQRSIDVVTPLPGADSVFTFRTIGRCGVIRCSTGTFKTVYATVPLEGFTKNTAGRLSRTHFIARCLKWFGMTVFYKVEGEPGTPGAGPDLALLPASPNPFRLRTTIQYQLPARASIGLKVYNVAGQLVRTLVDRTEDAGRHTVTWDGANDAGVRVTNGVYYFRLSDGRQERTGKTIVIR